jgi:predicted nucleotidyltransferase
MSTCIFETLVGSRAFGTHTEDSDWDYASVSLPESNKVLGLGYNPDKGTNFTPTAEKDTTDHTFQKFISLALKNNPSILDILFSPRKHWKLHTPTWVEIYNGRHAFLSKSVATTYVGYARSQLKRIHTHREWLLTPPKHKPSRESFGLPGNSTIPKEHREAIISIPQKFLAADIQDLARKEKGFAQAMDDWRKYDRWKRERNEARAALEAEFGYDTKHAMHLFRLLIQGREILETGELIVDRTDIDADLLRNIKHKGIYVYARLMEEVERMRAAIEEAEAKSTLPDKPDFDSINELCIRVMKSTVK